jgi:hypothetical protein
VVSVVREVVDRFHTALAIRAFLRHKVTPEEGRAATLKALREREQSFLTLVQDGVFHSPRSVYLRLLQHAGISFDDIKRDVNEVGLEATLEKLYDAGVYVTVEEFKGRAPIRRDGLEIPAEAVNFINPLAGDGMEASTSGSRGTATNTLRSFSRLTVDAGSNALFFQEQGYLDRPWAEWRQGDTYWPIFYGKFGKKLGRSFSTLDYSPAAIGIRKYLGDRLTRNLLRLFGIPTIKPEFVPANEPLKIVRWLAAQKASGHPAVLHTFSSSALRICTSAQENDIDISGTAMSVTGEPFTPAKARLVASAGVEALPKYSATETGSLGRACLAPVEVDEVHLNADKVAMIQRERQVPGGGVGGLFLTGIQTVFPRVMINMEVGDYATISQRDCGCPAQRLGLTTHIYGIRSYEKLTSEGVTFLGGELIELLEDVLPERFGGKVGDYQLAEEEEDDGVSRINVIVSPSVGDVDEAAIVETVLEVLAARGFGERRRMQEMWQQGNVLRVVRREPIRTGRAKVLPLHILGATRLESESGTRTPAAGS